VDPDPEFFPDSDPKLTEKSDPELTGKNSFRIHNIGCGGALHSVQILIRIQLFFSLSADPCKSGAGSCSDFSLILLEKLVTRHKNEKTYLRTKV
jgi:hypothetical protein